MEGITASEIAGLGVGAVLFCATIAAPKVDAFIASSQRRQNGVSLGCNYDTKQRSLCMCPSCGDLRVIACSQCKGQGYTKESWDFNLRIASNSGKTYAKENDVIKSKACSKCQAKGYFHCPKCFKIE